VWGARQASTLDGQRILLVAPLDRKSVSDPQAKTGSAFAAVDSLGAGPGDLVLVSQSSRCRDLTYGSALATKAVVLAIVDDFALDSAEDKP
jgi:ethanolamine utilization protein EutN